MNQEEVKEIPKQLQNNEFRFVLLGKEGTPKGKIPFEKEWQTKNNYAYDNKKLLTHISNKNNFGVIGGYGNIRILDIDEPKLAEEFEKKLKTYTIKTGSGGRHFYFISDYNKNHVLVNELGELRSNAYQVVSAPCKHPNGNSNKNKITGSVIEDNGKRGINVILIICLLPTLFLLILLGLLFFYQKRVVR